MRARLELSRDPAIAWRLPMSRRQIQDTCAALLAALGKPQAEVELALVSDREMAELNSQYLGCRSPTNVLSFSNGPTSCLGNAAGAADPENAFPEKICSQGVWPQSICPGTCNAELPELLGTLFISPQTVRRECFLYNQGPEERFTALLAHGLAHLMGFEHGPDMDELVDNALKTAKL